MDGSGRFSSSLACREEYVMRGPRNLDVGSGSRLHAIFMISHLIVPSMQDFSQTSKHEQNYS